MKEKIGLIGIGLVGTSLAKNLLSHDFDVVGFDVIKSKRLNLNRLGGKAVFSPYEVALEVNRVILSLLNSDIVREVIEGPNGLLQAEKMPEYIIDTTTGDPKKTKILAKKLLNRGIYFLDSTISGSSEQIQNRQGVFMVGGNKKAFESCRDIFKALAQKYFYIGPSGSGSKAKLASNLILGLNRLVLAEGLVFADKIGLNVKTFLSLLKSTPAYSCAMDVKGRKMIENDFKPQSRVIQHNKDLEIILKYAKKMGQELPLTRIHKKILEEIIITGEGEMDNSIVIKYIRNLRIGINKL